MPIDIEDAKEGLPLAATKPTRDKRRPPEAIDLPAGRFDAASNAIANDPVRDLLKDNGHDYGND